jgi:hypothetical protein
MPENFERQFDPWAKQENVSSTFDPSQEAKSIQAPNSEISIKENGQESVMPEKIEQPQTQPVETPIQEKNEPQVAETPTEKEEFAPKEALQKIKESPKEERRERLADFKERLALQKESLAKIQETMIVKIKENPDMSLEELKAIARDFAQKNDINTEQLNRTNEVLDRYVARHKLIKETREKYPDDRELFKALYGKYPDGKIEIVLDPLILTIRCHDVKDFAFIGYAGWMRDDFKLTEKHLAYVEVIGGSSHMPCKIPELQHSIVIENIEKTSEESLKIARVHEEQHVIHELFERKPIEGASVALEEMKERLSMAKTEKEVEKLFINGFRSERRKKEWDTKTELLAYFKTSSGPEVVSRVLKLKKEHGGIYDYFAKYTDPKFVEKMMGAYEEKYRIPIEKGLKQVFETEYHQLIDGAINAFRYLLKDSKYSREQAIAILMQEPLDRWAKVTERILKAKDSIRNRQEEQGLSELEKSQVEAMAENKARDVKKNPIQNPPKEDLNYKPDNEIEEDLTGF